MREQAPPTALVTGGTDGIGRATVMELASAGYRVFTFGLHDKHTEEVIAEAASKQYSVEAATLDVRDEVAVGFFVNQALNSCGSLDVLVNNAALRVAGSIGDTTLSDWHDSIAVNLTGAFIVTKAVVPGMVARGKGSIVNIGSGSGYGRPGLLAYCVTKGGLHTFTTALALDHARDGIRVNTVVPGGTVTGITRQFEDARFREFTERAARNNVAGRINQPEDVARVVGWLVSDAAATISGACIEVGTLPRVSSAL